MGRDKKGSEHIFLLMCSDPFLRWRKCAPTPFCIVVQKVFSAVQQLKLTFDGRLFALVKQMKSFRKFMARSVLANRLEQ